jgi:hypothetical protein
LFILSHVVSEYDAEKHCITNGFHNKFPSLTVSGYFAISLHAGLFLRLVDNIKINLREIGWDGMDWIDLAQDRDQWRALVNTIMNLRVP